MVFVLTLNGTTVVAGSAPVVSYMEIGPDQATTDDDLTCTYDYMGGKQGDSTFIWSVNDITVASGFTTTWYDYEEHDLSEDIWSACSVYAADIDGDGHWDRIP